MDINPSRGTVRAIGEELCVDGLIRRYDPELDSGGDGLPGAAGTFLACSFWMVDALCATGSVNEARGFFERLLSLRNAVGLLSEEYDPSKKRQLGNTPQAFSHVGLINAARTLTEAGATRLTSARGSGPHNTQRGPDRTSAP